MRAFARPTPLTRLSREARLVYSGFCVFMLVGYGTSVWFYQDDTLGVTPAASLAYYQGAQPKAAAEMATPGGPEMALPADIDDGPLRLPKSPRQVMETFHFHVFSMAVCLLILAHLFMMCRLSGATKGVVVISGFVATLVHVVAPPLIRLSSPGFAVLMFPSALGMACSWGAMTLWPLWEMWVMRQPGAPEL